MLTIKLNGLLNFLLFPSSWILKVSLDHLITILRVSILITTTLIDKGNTWYTFLQNFKSFELEYLTIVTSSCVRWHCRWIAAAAAATAVPTVVTMGTARAQLRDACQHISTHVTNWLQATNIFHINIQTIHYIISVSYFQIRV